jgi:hypothetical protein
MTRFILVTIQPPTIYLRLLLDLRVPNRMNHQDGQDPLTGFIGRNRTLRTKVEETYIMHWVDEIDTNTFDSSFDDGPLLHLIHLGSDELSYLHGGLVPVLDTICLVDMFQFLTPPELPPAAPSS